MGKNCLEGYLTEACKTCDDWSDGTRENTSVGCCCNFPIMECKAFADMFNNDPRNKEEL